MIALTGAFGARIISIISLPCRVRTMRSFKRFQGIYCELRFANDGGGESSKAIANLSHALGEAFPRSPAMGPAGVRDSHKAARVTRADQIGPRSTLGASPGRWLRASGENRGSRGGAGIGGMLLLWNRY
jgi:hypothetical protein